MTIMIPFNVNRRYWNVGGVIYSSASNSVVLDNDPAYVSWLANGNVASDVGTVANLNMVLIHTIGMTPAQMINLGIEFYATVSLSDLKTILQTALDALFDSNFDLSKFIRGGTATNITAANVGNFLSTITNNYRSLRAAIAAAPNLSALQAINIFAGWPSNP